MMRIMRHTEPRWTSLALAAAAVLPAIAPALGAQQPTPRPSRAATPRALRACDSCEVAELTALQAQLERAQRNLERAMDALAAQREALLASRDSSGEVQEAYVRLLGDARRARQVYDAALTTMMQRQLERSRAEVERAVRSAQAATQVPSGWLGATLSMQFTIEREGGKELMRFQGYPVVESVEPNSPAERAGLEASDRLMALNGRDVEAGTEPLARLLRPGNRIQMRVQRGDSTRLLTVLVGRRPEGEWGVGDIVARVRSVPGQPAAPMPPAPPTGAAPAPPLVPPLPPVPAAPLTVMTRDGMQIDLGGLESGVIAGAQLQRVGDLRDYFGVEDGLLVLRVLPGTVAERSGLRGGDVILRANDAPITTPLTLRRVMDRSTDQAVKLEVVRKRKKESVVLRWDR